MANQMLASAAAGAGLEILFSTFLQLVVRVARNCAHFKSSLKRLEEMLKDMDPNIKKIDAFNRELDRPKELDGLKELVGKGHDLVLKCSKIHRYNLYKKPLYNKKILKLEKEIRWHVDSVMQMQQIVDQKETLFGVQEVSTVSRETLIQVRQISKQISHSLCLSSSSGFSFSTKSGLVAVCSPPQLKVRPIGLEIPLRDLKIKLLKEEVPLIVVSAPGGCGKTTLATTLCHDLDVKEKFKGNIFFVTVSKQPNLLVIIKRLFQHTDCEFPEILCEEDALIQLEYLLNNIGPEPILLVLDDLWSGSESLLEKLKFPIKDYKILVTSRSELPGSGFTYKLQIMNSEDALRLFYDSASLQEGNSYIPDQEIVNKIVEGCKRFPLAIAVIGRSLRGKSAAEWRKRFKDSSKTASILSESELLNCLQSSVDALNNEVAVKECYMDLGSFPEDQRIPVTALIDIWVELHNLDEDYAIANLNELAGRNLVDLIVPRKDANEDDGSYYEHFAVQHDLLRELAIRQSDLGYIGYRKRIFIDINGNKIPDLWMDQMQPVISAKLLSISTDENFSSNWFSMHAAEVEVLILNFQTPSYTLPEFMERMDKLKVLIVTNYGLNPAEFCNCPRPASLSNLKRVRLEKVSLPSFFLTTIQLKKLEKISLVMCNIGQAFSNFGIKISDAFPNLVEIEIDYCNDLVELPVGFCDLFLLRKLSVTNCHKLTALPRSIGNLKNLEVLRLNSCIDLLDLPDTIGGLYELKILDLSDCLSITELPEEIGDLNNLRKLYMIDCSNCELPSSIRKLVNLKEVISDEETAGSWKHFKPYLPSLMIKVHKEINLNWLR